MSDVSLDFAQRGHSPGMKNLRDEEAVARVLTGRMRHMQ